MKKNIIAIAIVIGALVASTFVIAQPGIGISKQAPLVGTGSSGDKLRIDGCDRRARRSSGAARVGVRHRRWHRRGTARPGLRGLGHHGRAAQPYAAVLRGQRLGRRGLGQRRTPTCVATGTLDGAGSAGKLTYWTDADTLGYGTGSTSVQHQGSLSVTQDLSASGLLYVLGKLSDSTSTGTSGQVLTVTAAAIRGGRRRAAATSRASPRPRRSRAAAPRARARSPTSMSSARILGRTSASTGVVEQLTGTQATAMLDAFTSALQGSSRRREAARASTSVPMRRGRRRPTPTTRSSPRAWCRWETARRRSPAASPATGRTSRTAGRRICTGATTVGDFRGHVQTSTDTGTQNDYTLNDDTTVLISRRAASRSTVYPEDTTGAS